MTIKIEIRWFQGAAAPLPCIMWREGHHATWTLLLGRR